jgi:hypothetical protein
VVNSSRYVITLILFEVDAETGKKGEGRIMAGAPRTIRACNNLRAVTGRRNWPHTAATAAQAHCCGPFDLHPRG